MAQMESAELKMISFCLGVSRMEQMRNDHVRGTAGLEPFADDVRPARLR